MTKIVLVCIGLLAFTFGLNAQSTNSYWEEVTNPDGGRLNLFTVTNDAVCYNYYTWGGPIYRSADQGKNWDKIVLDNWVKDARLVIGLKGDFYRVSPGATLQSKFVLSHSDDEGENWNIVTADFPGLFLYQMRSGVLLTIDIFNKNVYRSNDGGSNWSLVVSGGAPYNFQRIDDLGHGLWILRAQDGAALHYSVDNGLTWPLMNNSLINNIVLAQSLDTLYAIQGTKLYRSFDRGDNWVQLLSHNVAINSIYAATNGKVYFIDNASKRFVSEDNGTNWSPISYSSIARPNTIAWVFDDQSLLGFSSNWGNYIRSEDGGNTWALATKGLAQASIKHIAFASESTLFAIINGGVAISGNKSESWDYIGAVRFLSTEKDYFSALNADTLAIIKSLDTVVVSLDGGQSYTPRYLGDFYPRELIFHPSSKKLICQGTTKQGQSGFYWSDDLGASWNFVQPSYGGINYMQIHPSGYLFGFSSASGDLMRVDPVDFSGTVVSPQGFKHELFYNKFHIGAGGQISVIYPSGNQSYLISSSQDEGTSWTSFELPPQYTLPVDYSVVINTLGHIFLTLENKSNSNIEIMTTTDQGESWFGKSLPSKATDRYITRLFVSPDGYVYASVEGTGLYRTTQSTHVGGYIRGHIQKDADAECSTPDAQDPLKWPVTIEGEQMFYVTPNAQTGKYEAFLPDTGIYEVSVRPSNDVWWDVCDDLKTVYLESHLSADTADFTALAVMECALMQVDVSAPRLRRCFDNTVYVNYCNVGGEVADSAYIDLELDPYLSMVSASQAYTHIGPNTYRFQLGRVLLEECGDFSFVAHVDCDSTVLGQTHCIEAHAWPDTLCNPLPSWSGADIEASATCLGDSIRLSLKNNSPFTSQSLEYVIVEDDVVLRGGPKQYGPFEEMNVVLPAQGRTMRIESEQEPNHPFSTLALAFKEGCNGFNSQGFVNQFAVNGSRPAHDVFCAQNVGAYDPNDKTGFPLGYGPQNRIRPGQDLEYMIRFQNTGTDTAFTVVIRDTLSAWLDPASVVPGASSHPYSWSLSGNGTLSFRFDQIMLPDSHKNVAASQGFVSFRLAQSANVPLGSKIFNKAEIYFDFNSPIVTNTTLHTVQIQQVTNTTEAAVSKNNTTAVSPNPMRESAIIRLNNGVFYDHQITLTDMLGRIVQQQRVSGSQYTIERAHMTSGIYAYKVEDKQGNLVGMGKLIVH